MQHIGILGKSTLQKFMNNSKVLILGANGMLGKMVSLYFASLNHFELILTAKNKSSFLSDQLGNDYELFDVLNDDFQNFAKSIKKATERNYWPKKPKIIITSQSYWFDDFFKFWVANDLGLLISFALYFLEILAIFLQSVETYILSTNFDFLHAISGYSHKA